jgi:hypothetical protein
MVSAAKLECRLALPHLARPVTSIQSQRVVRMA